MKVDTHTIDRTFDIINALADKCRPIFDITSKLLPNVIGRIEGLHMAEELHL